MSRNWPVTSSPQDTGILNMPRCLSHMGTFKASLLQAPEANRAMSVAGDFGTRVVGMWQCPRLTHQHLSVPLKSSVLPSKMPRITWIPREMSTNAQKGQHS